MFSVPIAEVLKRIYKLVGDPRSTALEVGLRYPQSDMSQPMKLEFEVGREHAQKFVHSPLFAVVPQVLK